MIKFLKELQPEVEVECRICYGKALASIDEGLITCVEAKDHGLSKYQFVGNRSVKLAIAWAQVFRRNLRS